MPRERLAKVVLSKEQMEMLREIASRLGMGESEALRVVLKDYVKELSMTKESIHRGKEQA